VIEALIKSANYETALASSFLLFILNMIFVL
jgi:hypothetical protein